MGNEQHDDGGPAFPVIAEGGEYSGLHPEFHSGMSKLDWFAGQVLPALIVKFKQHGSWTAPDEVQKAYDYAELMILESNRRTNPDA